MKKGNKGTKGTTLRNRAEKRLVETLALKGTFSKNEDPLKLIHELQVHQIELEMQNEELKQARAEIEASLEKYSDLYDFAPAGYFTLTGEGIIREVNLAGAALLGEDRSHLINRRFDIFVSDKTQPTFFTFLQKVCMGNIKETCEVSLYHGKDNPRYIYIEGTLVAAGKGQRQLCRMSVLDITKRKLAEEALREAKEGLEKRVKERTAEIQNAYEQLQLELTERKRVEEKLGESEQRFRLMFEHHKAVMLLVEPDSGAIIDANHAAEEFYGYPRAKLTTMNIGGINRLPSEMVAEERQKAKLGARNYFNFPHLLANGEIRTVEVHSTPIVVQGTLLLFSIVHDITERKQAEEENKRLVTQLLQAQKMEALGALAAGIAHDFNNILQPILINSDLISDTIPPDSQVREYIDQIIEAIQIGKHMIRQIKAFGSGKKGSSKPIALGPVVSNAMVFFKRSLPPHVKFTLSIKAQESLVQTSPTQAHQMIMNLCANAVQAMSPGKDSLEVSLHETDIDEAIPAIVNDLKPGRYVKLMVSDTGSGISPEAMEKIFDPFFTTKKAGMGTGLGLAVVYDVVKNAQGSILLSSEEGKGTRFEVYFPLHLDSPDKPFTLEIKDGQTT